MKDILSAQEIPTGDYTTAIHFVALLYKTFSPVSYKLPSTRLPRWERRLPAHAAPPFTFRGRIWVGWFCALG